MQQKTKRLQANIPFVQIRQVNIFKYKWKLCSTNEITQAQLENWKKNSIMSVFHVWNKTLELNYRKTDWVFTWVHFFHFFRWKIYSIVHWMIEDKYRHIRTHTDEWLWFFFMYTCWKPSQVYKVTAITKVDRKYWFLTVSLMHILCSNKWFWFSILMTSYAFDVSHHIENMYRIRKF